MPTKDPIKLKEKKKRWYAKNRERILEKNSTTKASEIRSRHLKRKFGISLEEWNKKLNDQGNKCEACGTYDPGSRYGWHTDHSHSSQQLRGILCHQCNIALGCVDDDLDRLQKLIDYLRKYDGN